ncbi:MAG: type II toxin-antitoxin system VapC family toxin [Kiritimatiellae bacterium]|jgi:PIN domain nuclease of toxin-antitoxin system|nr:type II toxin-antitoxin system VapC family toxin [Kiritimatiellia bacterium]
MDIGTHLVCDASNPTERLKKAERQRIASLDTIVYVSAVSAWEIEIKRGLGRIHLPDDWSTHVEQQGFLWLPISWKHTRQLSSLPDIHRDPFDRMLVAQAKADQITLNRLSPELARGRDEGREKRMRRNGA